MVQSSANNRGSFLAISGHHGDCGCSGVNKVHRFSYPVHSDAFWGSQTFNLCGIARMINMNFILSKSVALFHICFRVKPLFVKKNLPSFLSHNPITINISLFQSIWGTILFGLIECLLECELFHTQFYYVH